MKEDLIVSLDIDTHYELYCNMARAHQFPPLPKESINELLAYVKDGKILYTCFLWDTNSDMCMIGFPLSNLGIDYSDRDGLLKEFIKGICGFCKKRGFRIIWTTSGKERIMEALEEADFYKGDENVHLYLKTFS